MRKYGNLPISKVAYLQPKKVLNEREVKEIGTQLHISLSESAMVSFIFNHCISYNPNFNTYPAFDQLGSVIFLSCFEVDRIYVAFHLFLKKLFLLLPLISLVCLLYPRLCTRSIES